MTEQQLDRYLEGNLIVFVRGAKDPKIMDRINDYSTKLEIARGMERKIHYTCLLAIKNRNKTIIENNKNRNTTDKYYEIKGDSTIENTSTKQRKQFEKVIDTLYNIIPK